VRIREDENQDISLSGREKKNWNESIYRGSTKGSKQKRLDRLRGLQCQTLREKTTSERKGRKKGF